jgi:hypothetical protein
MGGNPSESARGDVSERVIDACHVKEGWRSRPGDTLTHCKPFEEAKGNGGGTAAGHASGPCDGWRIITANGNLGALHGWAKVCLEDCLME